MDLNLQNKVAIVTGGGRGIGEAICMAFANEGAHIVVTDVDNATANDDAWVEDVYDSFFIFSIDKLSNLTTSIFYCFFCTKTYRMKR